MSDFFAVFLILVALATAGNFAADTVNLSGNCKGSVVRLCW